MKCYVRLGVLLLSLFSFTLLAATPVAARSFDPSVVRTGNGVVKGTVTPTTRQFLGLPYAAPPVGVLRWQAPQPPASWSGICDATHFGNICPQIGSPLTGVLQSGLVGSEDCLFLNVYTPLPDQGEHPERGDVPVMLWIHGGGFTGGAASLYDPSALVAQGHVIVVTINYRLGALGYLALPGLSSENTRGTSGNYGLQDQQAALRWVHTNIVRFGGDPRNVTIFGESAGGASVCDQIASPFATGLFARAITESGPCASRAPSLATSKTSGITFASSLGCSTTTVACMRALSASTLVTAATLNPNRLPLSFSPNVDGVILPHAVKDALTSGQYNHVPVLEGTNRNEDTVFLLAQISASGVPIPLTVAQYTGTVQALFGPAAAQVLAHYPVSRVVSPDQALANVVTDSRFACPAQTADTLFAAGTRAYAYEFSDPNPFELIQLPFTPPDFPLGDAHATELTDVFQGMLGGVTIPLASAQLGLSQQMIAYWTSFATTGNPNSGATPFWPRLRTERELFQSLTSVGQGPHPIFTFSDEHQCSFWATLGI